jgi:hypothetical protein
MKRLPILAAVLLLCACRAPDPAPDEGVPDPQATGLRDAIAAPIDDAKAVEAADRERAEERDAALDAAGG